MLKQMKLNGNSRIVILHKWRCVKCGHGVIAEHKPDVPCMDCNGTEWAKHTASVIEACGKIQEEG